MQITSKKRTLNLLFSDVSVAVALVVFLRWYGTLKWTKRFVYYREERSIVCYCTQEEKLNFESFTQNGCYGNHPQPFKVAFYSIDANTSCSFTQQEELLDLITVLLTI